MRTAIYPPHTLHCTACTERGCTDPGRDKTEAAEWQHCACYHDERGHICCFCEAGLQISPTSMR